VIADCDKCTWEIDCPDEATKDRREQTHREVRHNAVAPTKPLVSVDLAVWEGLADDAVRKVAARGETFLLWEALQEFAVPDHPDPAQGMGHYAVKVHRRGLAHPCAFATSPRPGTNESSIRRWTGDAAKCSDEKHRPAVLIPRSEVAS
jgi:hypothetical protein